MLSRGDRSTDAQDDGGFTLTEMVVGMTMMTIVSTIALYLLVGMHRTVEHLTDTLSSQAISGTDTSFAIDQMTRVLRLADTPTVQAGYPTARFTTIAPNQVVFYANLNSRSGTAMRTPPTKIKLSISNGVLTENDYRPSTTTFGANYDYTTNYPTSPTSSLVLLRNINNPNVFGYCSADTDPSTKCTPAAQPTSVSYVTITLSLNAPTRAGSPSVTPHPLPSPAATAAIAITGALS